jgi:hypothetical protein
MTDSMFNTSPSISLWTILAISVTVITNKPLIAAGHLKFCMTIDNKYVNVDTYRCIDVEGYVCYV